MKESVKKYQKNAFYCKYFFSCEVVSNPYESNSSVIIFAGAYLPFVLYLRFSDVLSNDFKHLIVLLNLLDPTPMFSGVWKERGSMKRVECLREL